MNHLNSRIAATLVALLAALAIALTGCGDKRDPSMFDGSRLGTMEEVASAKVGPVPAENHAAPPKTVDVTEAINGQGLVEVNETSARWITRDPLATSLGAVTKQLMGYWGNDSVVVIRRPELEHDGRTYREYLIAPYPIIKR